MEYINITKYEFKYPSATLFLGKTGSGKTFLMKKILNKNKKKFNRIIAFCPILNDDYDFLDKKFVIRDKEKLNDIIDRQYELKKNNMHKPLLIILDDFIGTIDLRHDDIFSKLATNGRHCNITVFYISQFLTKIPPVIRDNLGYLCILNISQASLDTLTEYQDMYNKNDLFQLYRETRQKPYRGILIDNVSPYLKDKQKGILSVIPFH